MKTLFDNKEASDTYFLALAIVGFISIVMLLISRLQEHDRKKQTVVQQELIIKKDNSDWWLTLFLAVSAAIIGLIGRIG